MSASPRVQEAPWNLLQADDIYVSSVYLLEYDSPWRGIEKVPGELAQAVMNVLQHVGSLRPHDAQWLTLSPGAGPDVASGLHVPKNMHQMPSETQRKARRPSVQLLRPSCGLDARS